MHRQTWNRQQRSRFLSPDFVAIAVDPILYKLTHLQDFPGFEDKRHNLVLWARPTEAIKELVEYVQVKLQEAVPG